MFGVPSTSHLTTDVAELRRKFASRDLPESRVDELRAAYETALLWLNSRVWLQIGSTGGTPRR